MNSVYEVLDGLGIEYEKIEHEPVFTVEEADKVEGLIDGAQCKNLFLRDQKGKKHFLVIAEAHERVDLSGLGKKLGEKLSFASPERLKKYLGLEPGSVSVFGVINDEKKEVKVFISNTLLKYEKISFHPNVNSATLVISREDFKKFLSESGNEFEFIDL
jgi:Ala-tRNA(Pro) deacylase